VLDLAALEGQLGIEFALHGAEVVAIEGRQTNLAKAEFARHALELSNVELLHGDVRNLNRSDHGAFDVVLCAGILYHLDAASAVDLISNIASVCDRVAIIDTHFSEVEADSFTWQGRQYWGVCGQEHPPDSSDDQIAASLWYSLDNTTNFAFTRDSLCNLLRHVGFTSVFESLVPYEAYRAGWPDDSGPLVELRDRITLVAIKGEQQTVLSSPAVDMQPLLDRMERSCVNDAPGLLERVGRGIDKATRRCFRLVASTRGSWSDLLSGRSRPMGR
jgi:hypothetical protein